MNCTIEYQRKSVTASIPQWLGLSLAELELNASVQTAVGPKEHPIRHICGVAREAHIVVDQDMTDNRLQLCDCQKRPGLRIGAGISK